MNSLIGKTFGNLEVISLSLHQIKGNKTWNCKCKCGKMTTATTGKLNYGHKTSCGCMRAVRAKAIKRSGKNHIQWKGYGELSGSIWNRIQRCAKDRKKEFSISIDYAWNLYLKQEGKCAITGVDIYLAKSSKELCDGKNTASLDRINSSYGYVDGNVQWVHTVINRMKWDMLQSEFFAWCNMVVEQGKTNV